MNHGSSPSISQPFGAPWPCCSWAAVLQQHRGTEPGSHHAAGAQAAAQVQHRATCGEAMVGPGDPFWGALVVSG